jgi:HSP20 family protein
MVLQPSGGTAHQQGDARSSTSENFSARTWHRHCHEDRDHRDHPTTCAAITVAMPGLLVISNRSPGVKLEDISVAIAGNQITLTAEAKDEKAVDQGQGQETVLLRERRSGTNFREMQLPTEIDDSKAQAEFRDGVLLLTLGKKESAQTKRLSIR